MLLIHHFGKHRASAARLCGEALHHGREGLLEHIVGEHDAAPVAAHEAFCQAERLRDPTRPILIGVEEPLHAVLVAVPQQTEELARVRPTGDQHQLVHPRLDQRRHGVGHHRPVEQRQQMLVRDPRQRGESAARATRQDYSLHRRDARPAMGHRRRRLGRGSLNP
jgi:hypothetical protein